MKIETVLQTDGIDKTDLEVFLKEVIDVDRSWILAHPEYELPENHEKQMNEWIARRGQGEPVAYIIGKKEFYGREFQVDSSVLIPRPATEGLIDEVLGLGLGLGKSSPNPSPSPKVVDTKVVILTRLFGDISDVKTIVDIGTGSGCVAITLKLELPDFEVVATDVSEDAIRVAKKNAEKHQAEIDFRSGDLLDPIKNLDQPFIIVSNPPYIPQSEELMRDVRDYEPERALFGGGEEGTEVLARLMQGARNHSHCGGVVMECRDTQVSRL